MTITKYVIVDKKTLKIVAEEKSYEIAYKMVSRINSKKQFDKYKVMKKIITIVEELSEV